jgi:hypothetical protein
MSSHLLKYPVLFTGWSLENQSDIPLQRHYLVSSFWCNNDMQ